jgi:hypothetical protein
MPDESPNTGLRSAADRLNLTGTGTGHGDRQSVESTPDHRERTRTEPADAPADDPPANGLLRPSARLTRPTATPARATPSPTVGAAAVPLGTVDPAAHAKPGHAETAPARSAHDEAGHAETAPARSAHDEAAHAEAAPAEGIRLHPQHTEAAPAEADQIRSAQPEAAQALAPQREAAQPPAAQEPRNKPAPIQAGGIQVPQPEAAQAQAPRAEAIQAEAAEAEAAEAEAPQAEAPQAQATQAQAGQRDDVEVGTARAAASRAEAGEVTTDDVTPESAEPGAVESGAAWLSRGADSDAVPDVVLLPERRVRRPAADRGTPEPARAVFAGAARVPVPEQGAVPRDVPFWPLIRDEPGEPVGREPTNWPVPQMRSAHGWTLPPAGPGTKGRRAAVPKPPRRPALGLTALVLLALIAAFFAWVSAEPLWLAIGHSERGTGTVSRCIGEGMTQRCIGRFVAADGGFTVDGVALLGVDGARAPGAVVDARMVGPDSRQAYVVGSSTVLHLRWAVGVLLVLLCGFGIALATGARRLDHPRARRCAVLCCVGAPVLLLAGFLAASY